MPAFLRYPDIENSYREKFVELFKKEVKSDETFYVTEKIHGANSQCCFEIEDQTNPDYWVIRFGKRTSFIGQRAIFYNLPYILKFYLHRFVDCIMNRILKDENLSGKVQIVFYGEVFGGAYPHKDVDRFSKYLPVQSEKTCTVQRGVWYCPRNDWALFDIYVSTEAGGHFVSPSKMFQWAKESNIPTVPLLAIVNGIDAALNYPNNGNSQVYKRYDIPSIEENTMEGVVCKPEIDFNLSSGERAVFKNKSDKFKEIVAHRKKEPIELSSAMASLAAHADDYINENRLNSVISKYGEVERKDIGKIIGLFCKDVSDEFSKDFQHDLDLLTEVEQRQFVRVLNSKSAEYIRTVLVPKL